MKWNARLSAQRIVMEKAWRRSVWPSSWAGHAQEGQWRRQCHVTAGRLRQNMQVFIKRAYRMSTSRAWARSTKSAPRIGPAMSAKSKLQMKRRPPRAKTTMFVPITRSNGHAKRQQRVEAMTRRQDRRAKWSEKLTSVPVSTKKRRSETRWAI